MVPIFQDLGSSFALRGGLGELVVVQSDIARKGLLQIEWLVKANGFKSVANAPMQALNDSICFWGHGMGGPMLDAQLAAQHVKFMISTGLALPRSKQLIHEFHYVVGRQRDDFDLTDFVQRILETVGSGGRIVVIDFHELSARGPVNGYQQLGSAGFMGHLEP